MQHSDTVAAQMAGFSLARRLLAPDSKEARAMVERRHVLEWRVAEAAKFDKSAAALDQERAGAGKARADARAAARRRCLHRDIEGT